jgi:ABC-2 type transport system permease protein
MLWYKAWLETRVRFLMCLVAITTLCAANVSAMDLRIAGAQLVLWWLLGVNLLVMGGLLREKAVGAAAFSLALPVSRMRLTVVRMAVGVAQAMALIVIPWSAAIAMGALVGKTLSISQALFHLALLAGGGVLLFAIVFLVSSVVEGEYTAPMVSCGVLVIIALQFGEDAGLRAYNPVAFMLGSRIDDMGPVPWMRIAVYVLLAACLIVASVKAIQTREF